MSAVNRNAPCPCGSGKKYKKCCLQKYQARESLWRQLRNTEEQLSQKLIAYLAEEYPHEILSDAWTAFVNYRENPVFEFDSVENMMFFPWLLFNWIPDPDLAEDLDLPSGERLAEAYLARHESTLSGLEKELIRLSVEAPLSFYEILEIFPGQGFKLRDIFTGREVDLMERVGSQNARLHHILLLKNIQYQDVAIAIGTAPTLIPPRYKIEIIQLRSDMQEESEVPTDQDLKQWEDQIRELYFKIREQLIRPPVITNTDGDPLCFHELHYEITASPAEAFEKLQTLAAAAATPEELLEEAEFDAAGKLVSIEFPWARKGYRGMPSFSNTTLGHLIISKNKLTASVNSENRATKLDREIRKRLGNRVKHLSTEIKPLDEMLEKAGGPSLEEEEEEEKQALLNSPEIQEYLDQTLHDHWKSWLDMTIPALGGMTPRQAIQTAAGREMVKALLDDIEDTEKRGQGNLKQQKYIDWVRKELGL